MAHDKRLLAFAFASADVLVEADGDLRIAYARGATRSLLKAGEDALLGRPLLSLFAPSERGLVLGLLRGLAPQSRLPQAVVKLAGGAAAALGCYRPEAADGHFYLTLARARLSKAEEAVESRRDAETGLLAREDFTEAVGQGVRRARALGEKAQLTLVRLDDYEVFRSLLGPANEQRLLPELGALLRGAAVDGKTAGRLADDRYGVLAPPEAGALADRVAALTRSVDPTGAGARVSGACIDAAGTELSEEEAARVLAYSIQRFVEAADRPFTIASLSDGLRELVSDTVAETVRLKDAVATRGVTVLLQPIVALGTRTLHHYEALARFPSGQSPAHVIGIAERVGMIHDVDLMICQKVVDLMLAAAKEGRTPRVAVNISAGSLASASFIGAFRALLAPHAELRSRLLIEVTESMQIADLAAAEEVLQTLRRDGHAVCLDDFGAGAASFPYVQALTVDYVKIDGAYVKRVLSHPRDQAILKAMVQLCRELGVGTIAEMIETEAHEKKLLALGVDYGQGYLFGRPAGEAKLRAAAP